VDDDPSILRSLNRLIAASGFRVQRFGSQFELLASSLASKPGSHFAVANRLALV
jgi:FixJ family two-component response regulator